MKAIIKSTISTNNILCTQTGLGSILGIGITTLVEAIMLCIRIKESKEKWDEGLLITKREEFIKEIVDASTGFSCRLGGSIGGMFIGQFFIPIPILGAVVGMLVGTFAGDFFAKQISKRSSECVASFLEKLIKEMENIKQD